MTGMPKMIFFALIGVAFCGITASSGRRLRKSCPDLTKPKWSKKITYALTNFIQNQHAIPAYVRRCLPEITAFSCKRMKSREACLAFIWNHETYEGESLFLNRLLLIIIYHYPLLNGHGPWMF